MDKVVVTKSKLDSLAQHINAKAGTTGAKTIDQMQATVDGITGGKEEEAITVPLDMANGDQIVTPSEGKTLSQVTITQPDDLSPSRVVLGSNIGGVDGNYFAPEIWVLNEEIVVPAQPLTFTDLAFLTYATRKIDTNDPFPIQTMLRVTPTGKVGIVSRDAAGNGASIKRPAAMSSGDYTDTNGWYGESAHPQIGRIMVFLQPTSSRSVATWLKQNAVLYSGSTVIGHKKGLFELGDIDFDKVLNVTANGAYSIKPNVPYSTFGRATVNVNIPVPAIQDSKALTITSNGTVSVTPDAPYDALKKVDVTVNVASGGGGKTCKLNINVTTPPSANPGWSLEIYPADSSGEFITLDANNPSGEITLPYNGMFALIVPNGITIFEVNTSDWGTFDAANANGDYEQTPDIMRIYVCYAGETGDGTWGIVFR